MLVPFHFFAEETSRIAPDACYFFQCFADNAGEELGRSFNEVYHKKIEVAEKNKDCIEPNGEPEEPLDGPIEKDAAENVGSNEPIGESKERKGFFQMLVDSSIAQIDKNFGGKSNEVSIEQMEPAKENQDSNTETKKTNGAWSS